MFGIGGTELLVILVVALIVLGPKSVPQIARTLGKAMGEFRKVSTEFQRTLNTEIELEEHEKRKQEAEKELFGTEQKATAATKPAEAASPAAKPAAAIAAMTALPGAIAIRPWPAILPRRARSTGFLGQQPLDGKRDLSVRGHVDDLDFDRIAIVQDGCNVLHKLIGHLGNMDHAHAALRQRDKRAKRLHACDTTLENVSYLNCQSSILRFFS